MQTLLRRTTYIINNIEKTVHFYKDIIGLNLLWQTETTLNGNLPIGTPGDKAKFVAFNSKDPVIGMLAFLELIKDQNAPPQIKSNLEIGNSILVLGVGNCDDIFLKLTNIKAKIHKSPFDNSVIGRDGKKIMMKSMFAWDPNNIFLEINQRL